MQHRERSDAFENWFTDEGADQEEPQQENDYDDYDDRDDCDDYDRRE